MGSTVQPLRIDEDIMKIVEMKSRDENTNKTTALKQFLYSGIEEYLLKLCARGRISIGKVSEILHKSIYDLQESAKEKGIALGITEKEYEQGRKVTDKLV